MSKIVIVEDNPMTASLLKEAVDGDGLEVIGEYRSAEEALEGLNRMDVPDLMLLDIGLPGMSGIEAARIFKETIPNMEILIQTIFEDSRSIMDAIQAGVSGYLLKSSSRKEIRRAISEVLAGGSTLSSKIARKVLDEFSEKNTAQNKSLHPNPFSFTKREKEILEILVKGASYKEIAEHFSISVHTVNNHLRKVYEKMRVDSRAKATALALDQTNGRRR